MKKLMFIPLMLFAACAGGGNTEKTTPETPFFSGWFVYFADAALMTDCATGVRLPVAKEGAFMAVEEAYLALNPEMAEPIFVEFFGRVGERPRMEGEGTEQAFVVDSLIGFDRTRNCAPEQLLAGVYQSDGEVRRELRLQPDYTFAETLFGAEPDLPALMQTGFWWRTATLELVLRADDADSTLRSFRVDPAAESLVQQNVENPLTFRKTYL